MGGTEPQVNTIGALTCTETTNLALAAVAARIGQEQQCAAKLQKLLGAPVPLVGKTIIGSNYSASWIGPDQWMLSTPFETHEDIATLLKKDFGETASVIEQTDAWAAFDLSGDGIEAALELMCNINLRALGSGDTRRCTIHHLGCLIICNDPGSNIRILGPRASAGSLHHTILSSMMVVA
ncbi:sarcosine oxidase subunit gamma [Litoreibacter albidus]|uniref:sarcosine oxidase subunit gamma n=1 Tax=Litoreibacter albidus TaxID=670155 RepID=UPI0037352C31